jgi:hypothetical protein
MGRIIVNYFGNYGNAPPSSKVMGLLREYLFKSIIGE